MSYEQTEREAIDAAETWLRPPDEPYGLAGDDGRPDIHVTVDDELMVALAEAQTDAGSDFLDAYTSQDLVAVDVGRIIIPSDDLVDLMNAAEAEGLKVEEVRDVVT